MNTPNDACVSGVKLRVLPSEPTHQQGCIACMVSLIIAGYTDVLILRADSLLRHAVRPPDLIGVFDRLLWASRPANQPQLRSLGNIIV